MVTLALGLLDLADDRAPMPPDLALGSGRPSIRTMISSSPSLMQDQRAPRRCCSTSWAVMTAFSETLQNRAIFAFISLGRNWSVRHSRISGWIPISSSSFTLCWVGLVFSSPAVVM